MNAPLTVRKEWIGAVVSSFQHCADVGLLDEMDQLAARVSSTLKNIPVPATRCEALVAESLGHAFGANFLITLHKRLGIDECGCVPKIEHALIRSAPKSSTMSWDWLDSWTTNAVEVFRNHHPVDLADHVAFMMRRHSATRWSTGKLAASWHRRCSSRTLVHVFEARYSMHVRDYLHLCRLASALPKVRAGEKIEAVALESGFRSTRDFYLTFEQLSTEASDVSQDGQQCG